VRRLQSKDEIRKDGSQLQPVLETAPTTDAAATPAVSDAATASDEPPAESAETPASES
jgi:hypothetical protein